MLSNTNVKQLICNDPKIINNIIQKTMILGTKSNVKDNNNTKNDTIVSFVFLRIKPFTKHIYNTNIQFFFSLPHIYRASMDYVIYIKI